LTYFILRLTSLVFMIAGLALLLAAGASAHLVAKPVGKSLTARAEAQERNLAHARYVCRRGANANKRWHCAWVPILERELAKTRARLVPPAPMGRWHGVAVCESDIKGTGQPDWHINTGNGFYGGLQFVTSTWLWAQRLHGRYYASRADLATPAQQVLVAEALRLHDGLGHWPHCRRFFR
jgi:hypothetical protein